MPVQMLVGGVEIQMRLSGSEAVADGPYSFSSRFALLSTFSPAAIACAAPLMVHTSLKNSGEDCAKTSEVSDRPTSAERMRLIIRWDYTAVSCGSNLTLAIQKQSCSG